MTSLIARRAARPPPPAGAISTCWTRAASSGNIQQINPSAGHDWLEMFDTQALQLYLDHLHHAREPGGGRSFWVRPGDTPARDGG